MAALEYIFVGGGLLEPVHDLVKYYHEYSAHKIAKTLEALLADHLNYYWYRHGRMLQEHTAVEYGPHLPAQVDLLLRPNSDDWLGQEGGGIPRSIESYHVLKPDTLMENLEPVTPGELVQLNGFVVVRIKPWAAKLAYGQDQRIQIRVEYEQKKDITQRIDIGQSVAVRGQVLATRHGLLRDVVQAAFSTGIRVDFSPDDDWILTGLGQWGPYPNPLKRYPALLDDMLEGRRSIIHGDLHLRNILVDRDGRPWLIDFGRVHEGHTLFDFIKLETYIRLDVLSQISNFTLAEYVQFEEALANATYSGIWAAKLPRNPELRKAFRVIWAIRCLAHRIENQQPLAETYVRCLVLYNLAVLKYARKAVLSIESDAGEQARQLRAARLCFMAAAVQGRWLEDPPRPCLQLSGVLEQWRVSFLVKQLAKLSKPVFYLLIVAFLTTLVGLGYVVYQTDLQVRRVQAENLNSQGAIYMERGQLQTAADLFGQALQANPQYPTAHHNLGMAYYLQGDLEQAIEQFQMAIDLDSSYASPHYALGRIYDDQNQTEAALNEFQRAVELDPAMSEAYSELGYILNHQGKYAEALTILQAGLEQGGEANPPYLLKNLGWAYLGLNEPQRAVEPLEVAVARLNPGDALYIETHRLLAEVYEAIDAFDKALQEWQGPLRDELDASEHIQRLNALLRD